MKEERTLPDLENDLHVLNPGDAAELTQADYTRLFGVNDAATGRLANFARLHNCATMWHGPILVFRKQLPASNAPPGKQAN